MRLSQQLDKVSMAAHAAMLTPYTPRRLYSGLSARVWLRASLTDNCIKCTGRADASGSFCYKLAPFDESGDGVDVIKILRNDVLVGDLKMKRVFEEGD